MERYAPIAEHYCPFLLLSKAAGEVIADCIQRGVLPIKAKNKVRLLPPLNITEKQLSHALDVLYDVCCMEK